MRVEPGLKGLQLLSSSPSFSVACSMSSSGFDGNIAVIHLCFPLLNRGATRPVMDREASQVSHVTDGCCSLSVGLEQDLMFELLAFTQLQVEDEA